MARKGNSEVTSKKAASAASKVLSDPKSSKAEKIRGCLGSDTTTEQEVRSWSLARREDRFVGCTTDVHYVSGALRDAWSRGLSGGCDGKRWAYRSFPPAPAFASSLRSPPGTDVLSKPHTLQFQEDERYLDVVSRTVTTRPGSTSSSTSRTAGIRGKSASISLLLARRVTT